MALQAGQLLVVRRRLALADGETVIDTGITQPNLGLSPDPPLSGVSPSVESPDGVASRVMVMPLAPIDPWLDNNITHGEPTVGEAGTIVVTFTSNGEPTATVNALFLCPHTLLGPVSADPYEAPLCGVLLLVNSGTGFTEGV